MLQLNFLRFSYLILCLLIFSLVLSLLYNYKSDRLFKFSTRYTQYAQYNVENTASSASPTDSYVKSLKLRLKLNQDNNFNSIFTQSSKNVGEKLRDWHDYEFIEYEKSRVGLGEQGRPVKLSDPEEIERNEELFQQTGFYVVVSDKISVNRSVPDLRDVKCKYEKYLTKLPKVSIIIIFYNEVLSVLKRTIHAVINRTPRELIHEIILVNDNSDHSELYEPLQQYVFENFGNLVRIKNLLERKGLIVTRMEGAKLATGEVMVFLDSHVEVNVNWLPPLLDPIARYRNLSTVPIVDDFDAETFEYTGFGKGSRGVFDWNFIYKNILRKDSVFSSNILPSPTPVMLGCAFAINREYFWELGAYDDGLQIWNGENYELSFKLWMCEGGLGVYEVPCSRVAHNFRKINPSRASKRDFIGRNFKRVAEVWLDDYKNVLYANEPGRFDNIDPGDLTKQKKIHKDLKCKPFKYFLDEIAPDMASHWPPMVKPPVFASGSIRSLNDPELCIDTYGLNMVFQPIGLYPCEIDKNKTQNFVYSFHKAIATYNYDSCLDSFNLGLTDCNLVSFGNQYWKYDIESNMIMNGENCITADISNQKLMMAPCEEDDFNQKWEFDYLNLTAFSDWENIFGYDDIIWPDN